MLYFSFFLLTIFSFFIGFFLGKNSQKVNKKDIYKQENKFDTTPSQKKQKGWKSSPSEEVEKVRRYNLN